MLVVLAVNVSLPAPVKQASNGNLDRSVFKFIPAAIEHQPEPELRALVEKEREEIADENRRRSAPQSLARLEELGAEQLVKIGLKAHVLRLEPANLVIGCPERVASPEGFKGFEALVDRSLGVRRVAFDLKSPEFDCGKPFVQPVSQAIHAFVDVAINLKSVICVHPASSFLRQYTPA